MATDVDAVYRDFGTPEQRAIGHTTPIGARGAGPSGRVDGPQGRGGVDFVRRTGKRAAIGTLAELRGVIAGTAGTQVEPEAATQ